MPDAKWYASWVRMIPAQTAPEKMRNLEAADLIESLAAELEQVKRERDAAVEDLRDADRIDCEHCASYDDAATEERCGGADYLCDKCTRTDCPCRTCRDCSNWTWRGVREDAAETERKALSR